MRPLLASSSCRSAGQRTSQVLLRFPFLTRLVTREDRAWEGDEAATTALFTVQVLLLEESWSELFLLCSVQWSAPLLHNTIFSPAQVIW